MSTFIFALILALGSGACASNLAEVQDEGLADAQEMLEDNALEEDEQEIDAQGLDDEENLENQQMLNEDQQFQNQDQQMLNEDQQFQNQDQQMLNEDQQFQNQDQQMLNEDQQFQNQNQQMLNEDQQFQNQNQQMLNEGDPLLEMGEDNESGLTEVGLVEDNVDAGIASADAEGVPPPNEFSGAPPLPGTLKNLVSGEAPAEYRIEPGDTLYDICDQLLGEPGYWPKLWAMNDAIKNPHFVYPDFVLQFFPGDADQPPAMRVVGIEELEPEGKLNNEELVAEETEKLFKDGAEAELELLSPEDIVVPPEVKDLFRDDDDDIAAVEEATLVQLPALILPTKLDVMGEIVGGVDGAFSIQDDRDGFVRGGRLETGGVYTVLRYQGAVRNGLQGHGHRYDFIANLRVANFTGEAGIARAQVFSSVSLALAGDIVVEYRARSRRIALAGVDSGDTQGLIINLTHSGQQVGAMGDFAFLRADIGSDFAKNQVLKIFRNTDSRSRLVPDRTDVTHPIGTLQVIEVTEQGAISYIISSRKEIMLGDVIGSG